MDQTGGADGVEADLMVRQLFRAGCEDSSSVRQYGQYD